MNEHPNTTAARTARELLDGLRTKDLRALAVEALRRWRKDGPGQKLEFTMNGDLGRSLVPLLAERKGIRAAPNPDTVAERFLDRQVDPWMQPVVDLTAWLVTSGLAIPLQHTDLSLAGYTARYRLTAAGQTLLESEGDHPALPGFVERAAKGCPSLPMETTVHLTDAQTCLDYGLGRPAIALTGLGYEVAIDALVDHLDNRITLGKRPNARDKIAAVRKAIPGLIADPEARSRAERAWGFADQLRERRNQASHPGSHPDFTDLGEVHEWLLSAGRELPGLWSVRV
jgi:hypothetical protein